jgi:hypothetical protein
MWIPTCAASDKGGFACAGVTEFASLAETTEDLSDLCVEFFLVTEDTEALFVRDEIFARRQEVWE